MSKKLKSNTIVITKSEIESIIKEELVISESIILKEGNGDPSCDASASGMNWNGFNWPVSMRYYSAPPSINSQGEEVLDLGAADGQHQGMYPKDLIAGGSQRAAWDQREDWIGKYLKPFLAASVGLDPGSVLVLTRPRGVDDIPADARLQGFLNKSIYRAFLEAAKETWGKIDDDILADPKVGLGITGKSVLDYIVDPSDTAYRTVDTFLGWKLSQRPIIGMCIAANKNMAPKETKLESAFWRAVGMQARRWRACGDGEAFPPWFVDSAPEGVDVRGQNAALATASNVRQEIYDQMTVIAFEGPSGEYLFFPASQLDRDAMAVAASPERSWADCKESMDGAINEINKGVDLNVGALYGRIRRLMFKDSTPDLLCVRACAGQLAMSARGQVGDGGSGMSKGDWAGLVILMMITPAIVMGGFRLAGLAGHVARLRPLNLNTAKFRKLKGLAGPGVIKDGSKVLVADAQTFKMLNVAGAAEVNLTRGAQIGAKIRKTAEPLGAANEARLAELLRKSSRGKGLTNVEAAELAALEADAAVVAAVIKRAEYFEALSADNLVSTAYAHYQLVKNSAGGVSQMSLVRRDLILTVRTYFPWTGVGQQGAKRFGLETLQGMTAIGIGATSAGRIVTGKWDWLASQMSIWLNMVSFERMPEEYKAGVYVSDSPAAANYLRGLSKEFDEGSNNRKVLENISNVLRKIARNASVEGGFTRMELVKDLEVGVTFGIGGDDQLPGYLKMTDEEMKLLEELQGGGNVDGLGAGEALDSTTDDSIRRATNGEILNMVAQGELPTAYISQLSSTCQAWWDQNIQSLGMSMTDRFTRQKNIEGIVREKIDANGGEITVNGQKFTSPSDFPIWFQFGDGEQNTAYDVPDAAKRIVAGTSIPVSLAMTNFAFTWLSNNRIDTGG